MTKQAKYFNLSREQLKNLMKISWKAYSQKSFHFFSILLFLQASKELVLFPFIWKVNLSANTTRD